MAKKEYVFKGNNLAELQGMSLDEFADLLPSRERRTIKRGFTDNEKKLLSKLDKKGKAKTHSREMIVIPSMVGKVIGVHTGKAFEEVHVVEDMIGMRLGQLVFTRKRIAHSNPGVGASRSSAHASVR